MYSNLELAFLGDSVFELKIREYFLKIGIRKVDNLQKKCVNYASAKGHYNIMCYLKENDILSSEEINIFRRGRNCKVNQRRKNFNSEYYHASTGFEALIGYLYVNDKIERIDELVTIIIEGVNK